MVIEKKQRQSLHIRITTRFFSFSSWSERLDFSEFWLSEFRMSHITENLRGPHNPTRDAQRWRLHLCSGNKKISGGTPHDIFGWIVAVFYHWNMVNLEDAILILGVCRIQYDNITVCFASCALNFLHTLEFFPKSNVLNRVTISNKSWVPRGTLFIQWRISNFSFFGRSLFFQKGRANYSPPKTNMSPKKSMFGRCISYWHSPFFGDMLVFRGV